MEKRLIYLSGMMDGCSFEEGNSWRLKAAGYLEKSELFKIYNPYEGSRTTENTMPNEILHRDYHFLMKSDIILVNLILPSQIENKNIPFFTIGEAFLAHEYRKPIICFTNCLQHRNSLKAIATKILTNLEDSVDYILENY